MDSAIVMQAGLVTCVVLLAAMLPCSCCQWPVRGQDNWSRSNHSLVEGSSPYWRCDNKETALDKCLIGDQAAPCNGQSKPIRCRFEAHWQLSFRGNRQKFQQMRSRQNTFTCEHAKDEEAPIDLVKDLMPDLQHIAFIRCCCKVHVQEACKLVLQGKGT